MPKRQLKSEDKIKLKIIRCSIPGDCWYSNKIGKNFNFFDTIFKDDGADMESVWKFTTSSRLGFYVHLRDTNYYTIIRKQKINKINEHVNTI